MKAYLLDVFKVIQRRSLLALLLLSVMVTALEAMSVSIVIPAIGLVVDGRLPQFIQRLLAAAGVMGIGAQKVSLLCGIAGVFILRGVILSAILLTQSRITFNAQRRLSGLLFQRFVSARLEKVASVASATLVRTSTAELANITHGVMLPISILASETALVLGSMLVLLCLQPLAALALVVGTVVLSVPIVRLNKSRLGRYGKLRHDMEDNRVRLAQEMAAGIREVKVYRLERQLLEAIDTSNATYSRVMVGINFLQNFPRLYFETAGISLLLVICALQLARGATSAEVLMFLTVAGLAAFRALPSVAKVLAQIQALRFYRPSLTSFLSLMDELGPPATEPSPHDETRADRETRIRLELKAAAYRHSADAPALFKGVDLTLTSGDVVGLVGPSGVGKSTLLDCLIGLRQLSEGSLRIVDTVSGESISPRVSYVPQTPVMMDATVWRNIVLSQQDSPDLGPPTSRMAQALALSGFDTLMAARDLTLQSRVVEGGRNLSGGQRQRLALARALYRDAEILVLDEATSALDHATEHSIVENLCSHDTSRLVILVTHRLELLRHCNKIVEMKPGGQVSLRETAASLPVEKRAEELP